jgi:hypothetical protein
MGRKKKQGKKKVKQHYVPQFYLTGFTFDGDHLFVYDKFTRKSWRGSKRDIAHENYFYEIPTTMISKERRSEGINEKLLEDALAEYESKLGPAVRQMIDLETDQLIPQELIAKMAFYVAIQIMRTRGMRDELIQGELAIYQTLADGIRELNFPELPKGSVKIEFNEKFASFLQGRYIFDPEAQKEWVLGLGNMIWMIGLNETRRPLYTSDNPVVKINHIKEVGSRGWLSQGVEIRFPLSPDRILLMCESSCFQQLLQYDRQVVSISEQFVEDSNRRQIVGSHRQVFSKTDDFTQVEKVCDERPEICQPRDRVEIETFAMTEGDTPSQRKQIWHLKMKDTDG